jgi:hypothetical protein
MVLEYSVLQEDRKLLSEQIESLTEENSVLRGSIEKVTVTCLNFDFL